LREHHVNRLVFQGAAIVSIVVLAGLFSHASVVASATATIFLAALAASIAGFAFSAIAGAPLVYLFGDPVRAVSTMVVCSIAIQAYCVWALRRSIEWRPLAPFLASGALGVPLGVWLLLRTPAVVYCVGLGVFLIAYASYTLWRRNPPVLRGTWCHDAIAGALSGVAGGLTGFSGSFIAIWCGMRGWPKERQRALYQPYILIMQLEALAFLHWQVPAVLSPEVFVLYMPLALLAACAGLSVFRRLTSRQFSLAVNALLLVSGIALLGRSL
jgi:uncharacterized protein